MEIDRNFKIRLEGKKGGFVDIHEKTDNNKRLEHTAASQVLADKGHQIQLMPEIDKHDTANRTFFFPELRKENYKNQMQDLIEYLEILKCQMEILLQ